MSSTEEKKKPEVTPAWLRQIVGAFETVQNLMPEPTWLEGDFPHWVKRVGAEVAKALIFTGKLKEGGVWTAGEVGALIGHQFGYWLLTLEFVTEQLETAQKMTATEKASNVEFWRKMSEQFGADVRERIEEMLRVMLYDMAPAFQRAAAMALSIASEQEWLPMTKFFAAFTKALSRKPSMRSGIGRTTTLIHVIMLTNWREVEGLGGIPELRRWLVKNIFLTSQTVGDLKRVEKMCQRIGLSYREIAERKARANNPDMST